MRELGEPMECGIFDFYKVFSRAFGEGGMGRVGLRVEGGGCRDDLVFEKQVCTQLTPNPLTIISHTGSKKQRNRVPTSADELPVLYLIFRAGAGVEAGGGRAYGVRDF